MGQVAEQDAERRKANFMADTNQLWLAGSYDVV